jgi:hypothetical protein
MTRVLFLSLALFIAQAGPVALTTFSVPLRQMRPFPALLMKLGVAPVPTDLTPSDSSAFATAITNSVGGDTITLTAGQTYTGPFTLKSGLTSTVTIRSSGHASLPVNGQRVTSGDRTNMAIIVCGTVNNQKCFSTTGTDADNWRLTGLDMRQASGITNAEAMIKIGDHSETVTANTPNNIEVDHCWIETPQAGTVRGIFVNGRNINIHDNFISGFRNAGQECQAILYGGGPGPVTIDNNYLMALGEVFMSGGVTVGIHAANLTFTRNYSEAPQKYNPWNPSVFDINDVQGSTNLACSVTSSSTTVTCASHGVPVDTIRVIRLTSGPQAGETRTISAEPTTNTLTIETPFSANQSGVSATVYTPWTGHKNNFELKVLDGTTNLIEGNVFDGTWGMGQDGTGLVLTIRSEGGALSNATIKNTTIQYNWFRRFQQFVRYISPDDFNGGTGIPMNSVVIKHNLIEPSYQFSGPGLQSGSPNSSIRVALFNGASSTTHGTDVWFQHNTTYSARNLSTLVAFTGNTSGDWINYKLENNLFAVDNSFGGIFADGGATGTTALNNWCNGSGNYSAVNNTFQNQTTSGYPSGTFSETSASGFGFNDVANLDFKLTSGLYRAGQSRQASDGTDRGADITTLSTKIGASSNAYATATIKAVTGNWSGGGGGGTLLAKAGSFTGSGSTGNQAVTGVGFQPKVVLFRYNMAAVDGSQPDSIIGFGVGISSSDRRVAGNYSTNNSSPSVNAAWNQSTYAIYGPGGTPRADLVSMNADGFTINWVSASSMSVQYLALGGTGLTDVKTGSASAKTTTGTQAYTGLGFQPTALIVFAGKFSTSPLDQSTNGNGLFGVATSSSARGMVAWRNVNGANPQTAKRRQSTQRILSTTTTFTEADLVSFDSDGFTLNYTTAGGAADVFYYLALRGPQVKVSSFNQPASTGNQSLTGAGFTPKASIMMSANDVSGNNDAAQAHARVSFGWATGTSARASLWIGETDNVSPTVASRNIDSTKLIKLMTEGVSPTVNAAADHVSFDSDGQTINWTTADATARQIIVLWIG